MRSVCRRKNNSEYMMEIFEKYSEKLKKA